MYEIGFFENFFEIDEGGQFVVECVSIDCISSKCPFLFNFEVSSRKFLNSKNVNSNLKLNLKIKFTFFKFRKNRKYKSIF